MFSPHCVYQSILLYAKGYLSRFIPPLTLNITNVYQVKCLAPGMDYKWPWVHILKPVTSFIRWLPQWFLGGYCNILLFLCLSGKIIRIKKFWWRLYMKYSACLQRGTRIGVSKITSMWTILSFEAQILNWMQRAYPGKVRPP
jgi:hypothetical protein